MSTHQPVIIMINNANDDVLPDSPSAHSFSINNDFLQDNLQHSILHMNIRSLSKHFDELTVLLDTMQAKPAIIALSETWINQNDNVMMYNLEGYSPIICKNRHDSRGGGVALFVASNLTYKVNLHNPADGEFLSVNCYMGGKILFRVAVLYNPPTASKSNFIAFIDTVLADFATDSFPSYLLGI